MIAFIFKIIIFWIKYSLKWSNVFVCDKLEYNHYSKHNKTISLITWQHKALKLLSFTYQVWTQSAGQKL